MSTDIKHDNSAAPEAGGEDRIANLQKEFTRKLSNVESTLKQSNDQLLAQIQGLLKPKATTPTPTSSEDLETLMYTKPAEAIKRIKDEAKSEMRTEIDEREAHNIKRTTVLNSLYKDFPELAVDDSDLTKLALTKFNELSKEYGNSPASYKAAVAEAALELGVRPKSKRPVQDEDFSLSGSNRGRPSKQDKEMDAKTEMVAKLMGVDPAKVKARTDKRKTFGTWE